MKQIPLTRGRFALVDDDDFSYVSQWKWYCSSKGYAIRGVRNKKGVRHIWMHRDLMRTPTGKDTDHINRNKLDNRKSNLRIVTRSHNMHNLDKQINNKSGYQGVCWHKAMKKWHVQSCVNGVRYNLGFYKDKEQTAKVYQDFTAAHYA